MQSAATLILATVLYLIFSCSVLQAAPKYLFKISSLAPAGSVWAEQFDNFAKEVGEKTGGEIGFRVYPGGVMGDDQAMYRKMRVGQLHGGGFTMTGISAVVPDFRVMSIPFLLESYDEVDYVKKGLFPVFKEQFSKKGLEFIAMTEVGFLYGMSTKPIYTLKDQQEATNWSPSGDPMSEAYFEALGISPIQLSIPDVLSSLQSGLVNTVYNSLYGSIVLQWFTKARYIIDFPFGYAYGCFAMDSRKFKKLPESHQKIIYDAAKIHFPVLLQNTRDSNSESRRVLIDRGSKFHEVDESLIQLYREKSNQAVATMIPKTLSQEIHDLTKKLLQEFRSQKRAEKSN